jgi:hypothetical protein
VYTVVIRNETSKTTVVKRTDDLTRLLKTLLRQRRDAHAAEPSWITRANDAFIRAHYRNDMSAAQIAAKLCVGRRKVTKNMVISRAAALGLTRQRFPNRETAAVPAQAQMVHAEH